MAFRRSTLTPFSNAHLNYPKKSETIYDINIGSISSAHNCIQSSANLLAFQTTSDGGKLAVIPLDVRGKIPINQLNHVLVSGEPLCDFVFLKYPSTTDTLIASTKCGPVKVFSLAQFSSNHGEVLSEEIAQIDLNIGNIECLATHKSVQNFFVTGGSNGWISVDVAACQPVLSCATMSQIKSIDFSPCGNFIATLQTHDKIRNMTMYDARSMDIVSNYRAHSAIGRECRIIHGGKYVISSGFNENRAQELVLYDTVAGKEFVRRTFDTSMSILIPAFDEDSKMLFYAAKGSSIIRHVDTDNMDMVAEKSMVCPTQTLGYCLLPKLKCDVMKGEVQRVYQLHSSGIAPIPCVAIRRTYSEFHSDLFPDTAGQESGGTVAEWITRADRHIQRVSLRPPDIPATTFVGGSGVSRIGDKLITHSKIQTIPKNSVHNETIVPTATIQQNANLQNLDIDTTTLPPSAPANANENSSKNIFPGKNIEGHQTSRSVQSSMLQVGRKYQIRSPYYNIKVAPKKPGTISDVRDINSRISPDGSFFVCSSKYAAVAMSKIDGSVAIYDISCLGRTPEGSLDAIFNKGQLYDMQFDPFDSNRLICILSSGVMKVWDLSQAEYCTNHVPPKPELDLGMKNVIMPDNGGYATLSKLLPVAEFNLNLQKAVLVRLNPTAKAIAAVASNDGMVVVLNITSGQELFRQQIHNSCIVSLSWNNEGNFLSSIDNGDLITVFDIRRSNFCISQRSFKMKSPRAIFAGPIGNEVLFVTYLEGSIYKWVIFDPTDLKMLTEESIGSSQGSQSMRPLYDYDSGIVFMTAKGSTNIFMVQVSAHGKTADVLPSTMPTQHHAIYVLPKLVVDPYIVEIVRILRITANSIEIMSFVVPRREKNCYFRELYPVALATWEPSQAADEWLSSKSIERKYVDLKPVDMTEIPARTNLISPTVTVKTDCEVVTPSHCSNNRSILEKCWSEAIAVDKSALPQDEFDGATADDWDDDNAKSP